MSLLDLSSHEVLNPHHYAGADEREQQGQPDYIGQESRGHEEEPSDNDESTRQQLIGRKHPSPKALPDLDDHLEPLHPGHERPHAPGEDDQEDGGFRAEMATHLDQKVKLQQRNEGK